MKMALVGGKTVLKKVIIPLNTDFLLGVNPELKMWRMYGNITYNFFVNTKTLVVFL